MSTKLSKRFRGFLPVVVDVETGGLNPLKDALLEIAAVPIHMNKDGQVQSGETIAVHVQPEKGLRLDPEALSINGIIPDHPFRFALPEKEALQEIFKPVRAAMQRADCTRAILVGHNAAFDLSFLQAAATRQEIKRNPFHAFSTFDTVSLAALAYGETILAKACQAAGISFNANEAHSAIYDVEKTAELFCKVVNNYDIYKKGQG